MDQSCEVESKNVITSSAPFGWEGVAVIHGRNDDGLILDHVIAPRHHICMIIGQSVTWECDDGRGMRRLTTDPGQMCIYPANLPTSRHIPQPLEFITLMLAPEKLQSGLREKDWPQSVEFPISHNVEDPRLQGLMRILLAEAESGNPNGRLFVESVTLALSIHFVKQYARKPEPLPNIQSNLSARQLRRALEYIEGNLSEEISLETLAYETGLSKYYFSRLFKQATGQTPYQYVMQRRLERAKAFLQQGGINIIDAAHFFGFSDQSHFSRLFKKSYGMTPGGFLKNVAELRN